MTAIEDIRDVFRMLHDADISAWTGDKNLLTLTINCGYLAELIDKSFGKFYVSLYGIDKIEFDSWPNPPADSTILKTDLHDIFKAELQMNSANIKDDKTIVVTCFQFDTEFDYCGGDLIFSCQSIKLFDHKKNEMTIEQLDKICNDYWNQWNKE